MGRALGVIIWFLTLASVWMFLSGGHSAGILFPELP